MALVEGTGRPKSSTPKRPSRREAPTSTSSTSGSSSQEPRSSTETSSGSSAPATTPTRAPVTGGSSSAGSTSTDAPSSGTGTSNSSSAYDRGHEFAVGDIDFESYDEPQISYAVDPGEEAVEAPAADSEETVENGEVDMSDWVEIDGELVHPSDVHLYNQRPDEAEGVADGEVDMSDWVEIDGELVHPSDVHLYNQRPDEEAPAAPPENADEQFVLEAGDPDNPFPNHNATSVEVTPWDGTGGQPNDHIEGILLNQGYTVEEIYAADENGQTLIDQVAGANELEDPNIIHPGQNLVVPTTAPPSPPLQDTYVNEGFPGDNPDDLTSEGTDQGENFVVDGLEGDDYIDVYAEGGNDTISIAGGAGEDSILLDAGGGSDQATIDAGHGNDEIIIQTGTEDRIQVDGGEGFDSTTVQAQDGAEIVFDEETGQNTVVVDGGTEILLDGVEQVVVTDGDGEELHYVRNEDGELTTIDPDAVAVDPNAPAVDPDAPAVDPDAPAVESEELSAEQALNVLGDNYAWVADPEQGDADQGDDARVHDGLARIAEDEWTGREAYLDNLTSSVNPETGTLYTSEEATSRADGLQDAARVVLENDTVRNVLDTGDDNGGVDDKFDFDDIDRARSLFSEETQTHLAVLDEQAGALRAHDERFVSGQQSGGVSRATLDDIADLFENENYEAWANGEIDLNEFVERDGGRGTTLENLLQNVDVPEGVEPLEVIDELVEAARFVSQDEVFQRISAADGEHFYDFLLGETLDYQNDIAAVAGL